MSVNIKSLFQTDQGKRSTYRKNVSLDRVWLKTFYNLHIYNFSFLLTSS